MSEKKILVVDDEREVCLYLARLFEEHGYSAAWATDGYEAATKVKQARPDLITLDLSMPSKSGVKFYREMRSTPELSRIPIVFVTAVAGLGGNPRDAERLYIAKHQVPPPEGFVPKPVNADEMIQLVSRLLASKDVVSSL
jgi:CheY-like chemotaxis protein